MTFLKRQKLSESELNYKMQDKEIYYVSKGYAALAYTKRG